MTDKYDLILSEFFKQKLTNEKETGMGYHKVNVRLKNGKILQNKIVINCSILKIEKDTIITIEDIEDILLA